MVPSKRQMAGVEKTRRRILDLYQGGMSLERIRHNVGGTSVDHVRRVLEREGIAVEKERVHKPIRMEEEAMTNEKKQPTREDLEELKEQIHDHRKSSIERSIYEADASGEIARRAEERGVSYGDALVELAEELEAPFKAIDRKHREERLEREFGGPLPDSATVETEEEERENYGFTNKEVKARAKAKGVSYQEAFTHLAEERGRHQGPKEAPAVVLDERAEKGLDRRARAYAEKHGVSYTAALNRVLGEEG